MPKNMNLLLLKHKFQRKSLNLRRFLLMFTNCVDFKVGLRNLAKFELLWS